jgi:hypothetical protein
MRLIDINHNPIEPTLKAISNALFSGMVQTEDGMVTMTNYNGEEHPRIVVIDNLIHPTESTDYDNEDEAYIRFRFLVEAYYQVGLPCL